MKLVLLPGLDGTGNLFAPILPLLGAFDCLVIKLPTAGRQDYQSLTQYVKGKLPRDDFILLAESFSGPIGASLAMAGIGNLRAIIFVAALLSTPTHLGLHLLRILPLKSMMKLPFAEYFYKRLLLGADAGNEPTLLFKNTVAELSASLIRARLGAINSLVPLNTHSDLPAIYIKAARDVLIPKSNLAIFQACFSRLTVTTINGPHFILQAKPEASADAILQVIPLLKGESHALLSS